MPRNLLVILSALFFANSYCQESDSLLLLSDEQFGKYEEISIDPETSARYFMELSREAYTSHIYDSAYYYLEIAGRFCNQTQSTQLEGDWHFHHGRALYYQNRHAESVQLLQRSIKLRTMSMDTSGLAEAYNALGTAHKHLAQYSEAIRSFNRANQFYHVLNDSLGTGLVELNIGNVLKNLGRSARAKEKYHHALNIFKKLGHERNQASCYNNLGNVHKNDEQYDSAFYYMFKTMRLRIEQGGGIPLAYVYHNLANLYTRTEKYDSAVYYIEQSISIKSRFDNPVQLASDYDAYGFIYESQEKWPEAIRYFEKARELSNGDEYGESQLDLLESLARSYYHAGNKEKSAQYYNEYFTLKDSIQGQGTLLAEDELILYEYYRDSIESEQLILQRELTQTSNERDEIQVEANEKRYFYVVSILILALVLIIYLFISLRRRLATSRKHRKVLAERNEELQRTLISKEEKEILLKEIHHRVKNNLQIINSLIRLQSNFMNEGNFQEKLMETENRIRSMALIHEKLYKSDNLSSLSVRNYIEELSIHISDSFEYDLKVKFTIDVEEREYRIDSLIPLGLIINEVISNALKYAFQQKEEGEVSLKLTSDGTNTYLDISDNGLGAQSSLEELKDGSLGIDLIMSLTDQLDGELHLDTTEGFHYQFKFPFLK